MSNRFSDQDVLKLLSGLKNAESTYPTDMIQSRRDTYVKQAAAMAVLMKVGQSSGGGVSPAGSIPSVPNPLAKLLPSAGKLLEIVFVSVIILETIIVAYVYRDRISDFFNDVISPRVESVTSPNNDLVSPSLAAPVSSTETVTETPAPTITVTVTEEPTASIIAPSNNGNVDNEQISTTPIPRDNPGNHYGNTPKPDRPKNKEK